MAEPENGVGRQLGHYRIVSLLGKGGFADVYLGEHIHLNTLAAVKLLHTRLVDEDVENFRREAQLIARLVHPNIVRVFDFGVEDNVPYLVMDYAPEGTLRQRYPRGAALPLATVVTYVRQIAEALQYAHDQRLIHRDVKPENMLLGRQHELLLSDFGIALAAQSSNYQHTQNVAGTIAYMAPEQIQAHPRPASDQYALGIVVYEWLCGTRPFQGSFTEIAVKHTMVPPPPLRVQLPGLPPAVEQVVMIALQKDPRQRFPSVRAFALALEQASMAAPANFAFPAPPPAAPVMAAQPTGATAFAGLPNPISDPSTAPPSAYLYNTYNTYSVHGVPLPSAGAPLFNMPPPAIPASKIQPQRRVARRNLLVGIAGALVVGSGLTWYVTSRLAGNTPSLLQTIGTRYASTRSASPFTSDPPILTYSAQQDYVWATDWSPDGQYIASGAHDGTTHVWTATGGRRILSYRSAIRPPVSDDWPMHVAWSPDSKQVAIGFIDGTAQVVDIASGETVRTYGQGPAAPIYAVTWAPRGRYLAVASGDDTVRVYAAASGNLVTTFTKHTDTVLSVAWSYDGTRIASGSVDGKAKVWNPATGEELLDYTAHQGEVRSVAWSHDSTRIVSASWDQTVKVWEATTGHTLYTYSEQPTPQMMDTAAWSHNDKHIAIGSHDIYLRICNATTGALVRSFVAYPVFSLAWSPDDTRVVTAGLSDKKVQVWRVQ